MSIRGWWTRRWGLRTDTLTILLIRGSVKETPIVSIAMQCERRCERRRELLTTWDYSNTVAEVLQISYDPAKLPLREIISFFYRIHDPTTLNSQGADKGTQYRSAIFYHDASDLAIIEEVTEEYSKKWKAPLVTKIEPIKNFYDAEDYHQEYLFKNPDGYHCETHYIRGFD